MHSVSSLSAATEATTTHLSSAGDGAASVVAPAAAAAALDHAPHVMTNKFLRLITQFKWHRIRSVRFYKAPYWRRCFFGSKYPCNC